MKQQKTSTTKQKKRQNHLPFIFYNPNLKKQTTTDGYEEVILFCVESKNGLMGDRHVGAIIKMFQVLVRAVKFFLK